MPFFLKGVSEMAALVRQAGAKFPDETGRAMYMEAQIEMTEAKRRTPVDTGALRASGHVLQPEFSGKNITVVLAFGMEYAVIVHEDLHAFHKIGEAKYLEGPLKESAPHMAGRIARRIDLNRIIRKI